MGFATYNPVTLGARNGVLIDTYQNVEIPHGNLILANDLTMTAGDLIITTPTTPASATATGTIGTVAWDTNYMYVCVATDTWKRSAIATW
jgi:hypothetical protein